MTNESGTDDESGLKLVNQDRDLEFRKDGLWYELESNLSFSGVAASYHSNGKLKSRTKIRNGIAYGLIEEWDENGSIQGTPLRTSLGNENKPWSFHNLVLHFFLLARWSS